jgi:hypothetical protein
MTTSATSDKDRGDGDLRSAGIISNPAWVMDHQGIGDNHNARHSPGAAGRWRALIESLPCPIR